MKTAIQSLLLVLFSCLACQGKALDLIYLPYHDNDGSVWSFFSSTQQMRSSPIQSGEATRNEREFGAPLKLEAAIAIANWHFYKQGMKNFKMEFISQDYINLSGDPFKGGRRTDYRDFWVMTAMPVKHAPTYRPNHSKQTIVILMDGTVIAPKKVKNAG